MGKKEKNIACVYIKVCYITPAGLVVMVLALKAGSMYLVQFVCVFVSCAVSRVCKISC